MRNLFANDVVALEAGRAISGIARQARTLRVTSGRVWLTIEGAPGDYWLEAGDAMTLSPNRLVVLEADAADSRVETVAAQPYSRRNSLKFAAWPAAQRWIAAHMAKGFENGAGSGARVSHCHGN